jgi:hypothetical protein
MENKMKNMENKMKFGCCAGMLVVNGICLAVVLLLDTGSSYTYQSICNQCGTNQLQAALIPLYTA